MKQQGSVSVWVNGAKGSMGSHTTAAIQASPGLHLVGSSDKEVHLSSCLSQTQPQVCVDFTHPSVAFTNTQAIIAAGVRPVIGTSGLTPQQIKELQKQAHQSKLGGVIAPNFAIGAVLLMRFAAEAAKHLPYVEIIEIHHDGKADAPSGTAIRTAEGIQAARPQAPTLKTVSKELHPGALGATINQIPTHSLRLPGFIASQEVILSDQGEHLRITHQVLNRGCFMPGVLHACRKAPSLNQLHYGLEQIL